MNETPFCEMKLRPWIILLVLFAAGALAYSFWSALATGRLRMSGYHLSLGNPAAGPPPERRATGGQPRWQPGVPPAVSLLPAPVAQIVAPAFQMAGPAVQPVAMTNTYPQYSPWSAGTSVFPSQLDAVTMPTPMGGIKFIGGTGATGPNAGATPDFSWVAEVIRPCVVEINAIRSGSVSMPVADLNGARFVEPFNGVPDKVIGQLAFESVGSGLIVDPSGYVVTNHHVVAGASTIVITRFQQTEGYYSARIVASDPGKDLALLQILGEGPFPAATLADSSRVQVGEPVLTVGNPFGFGNTVSAGIISGKRDSLMINGVNFNGLLQTDAPINKGSSGGPLVNINGQVVGINTAIYAPTGVFSGMGFAIPSNRVGAFVARAIGNEAVTVAMQKPVSPGGVWLGIGVIDMTPDLAAKLSYPHVGGVYVGSVVLDSPADEAEIARGDIITAVSGEPMQDSASLQSVLARLRLGQTISVTIWRGGKTDTLKLTTKAGVKAGG